MQFSPSLIRSNLIFPQCSSRHNERISLCPTTVITIFEQFGGQATHWRNGAIRFCWENFTLKNTGNSFCSRMKIRRFDKKEQWIAEKKIPPLGKLSSLLSVCIQLIQRSLWKVTRSFLPSCFIFQEAENRNVQGNFSSDTQHKLHLSSTHHLPHLAWKKGWGRD